MRTPDWLLASAAVWVLGFCGPASLAAGEKKAASAQAAATTHRAETLDKLLEDLTSGSGPAQARARRLLVDYGAQAAERLLPLLTHSNETAARAAFTSLRDIVHANTRERQAVSRQVARLLDENRSRKEKLIGLGLLPFALPEDDDASLLAAYLKSPDKELREKARLGLQAAGTPQARAQLRAALARSEEPDFQAAILDSLGQLRDEESLELARPLTERAQTTGVQCAAARAIAWSAKTADAARIEKALSEASGAARQDLLDSLLKNAGALQDSGQTESASAICLRLLAGGDPLAQGAAISALEKMPSPEHAQAILKTVEKAPEPQQRLGIAALGGMLDAPAAAKLLALYLSLESQVKPAALLALGSAAPPAAETLALLLAEAASSDIEIRLAAYQALARLNAPQAAGVLAKATQAQEHREAWEARRHLFALTDSLANAAGKESEAAQAYLVMMRSTSDAETKARALRGLALSPSEEAASAVLEAAQDKALRAEAVRALAQIIPLSYKSGKQAQAQQALETLMGLAPSYEALEALLRRCREAGWALDSGRLFGTVREWWVAGPFKAQEMSEGYGVSFLDEKALTIKQVRASAASAQEGKPVWKKARGEGDQGMVGLIGPLPDERNCFGYAYTEIEVAGDQAARLRLGSDDGVVVWVNGAKVYEKQADRGTRPDDDIVAVRLYPGINRVLLKIAQYGGGWGFCARLTDKEGRPAQFKEAGYKE